MCMHSMAQTGIATTSAFVTFTAIGSVLSYLRQIHTQLSRQSSQICTSSRLPQAVNSKSFRIPPNGLQVRLRLSESGSRTSEMCLLPLSLQMKIQFAILMTRLKVWRQSTVPLSSSASQMLTTTTFTWRALKKVSSKRFLGSLTCLVSKISQSLLSSYPRLM